VWHDDDSYLHRLNPLSKLAACVLAAVVVSTASEPITPAVVMVVALLATRMMGHVPWRLLFRAMTFGALAAFGVFWTYSLFYGGGGPAWVYGLVMATRLLAILTTSMMFVLTSDPSQFVRSLIHQARVSPKIAYSVFAAYRFVPLLEVEFDTIRAAHRLRAGARKDTPLERARELIGYAIPLLASAVRKGERVALAMESRGFGALPHRTYFKTTTIGRADATFLALCVGFAAALVAARFVFQELP
jgi:energy-coupling factor transport system permease protein